MSGNIAYVAPDGESLYQRQQINVLLAGMTGIEAALNAKVDITKYQGKINLLEANDLRHDADIAYLEANKLDKTTFDAKINTLLAKDAIHDARLATLDAVKHSKANLSDYQAAIAGLTGVDAAFDHRLDVLENQFTDLAGPTGQLATAVQNIVQNYVLNTTYNAAIEALNNSDSFLAGEILKKADQSIANSIQAGLTAIGNDKVSKTEFQAGMTGLNNKNLTWERRLAAVDQYILAMIETYEIKKPGTTGAYQYTAAYQPNWTMKEDHFSIIGRQPGGEIVLEIPEFAYNTFYGNIKMFLNSSVPANTKVKGEVSGTIPRRLIMDAGFASTVDFNASTHFPIVITMYDSAGAEIKTKTIENIVKYQELPIITGAAFTYAKTSFNLVRGINTTDNNLNLTPIAYGGSDLSGATWAVTNGSLPAGISLNPITGAITGYPNSDAVVVTSSATISSTKASHVNSLVLYFNVVAPHTISYTPNNEYARNADITPPLSVNMTNNGAPNNVFTFSVVDPDPIQSEANPNGPTEAEAAAGMFTKGVYITKVYDAIHNRPAGTIWGNPKNVGTRTYTIKAVGLNGVEATTQVELNVVHRLPAFNYNHVIVGPDGTTWNDYVHTIRENDVVVYLPNIAADSGEIKGADFPGVAKPNYEFTVLNGTVPTGNLPATAKLDPEGNDIPLIGASNLVFNKKSGKIYTPEILPVNGVAQKQGVLTPFGPITFTITANGPAGSSTATFKLQCLGPIPSFEYNPLSMEFVKGVAGSTGPIDVSGVNATGAFTLFNLAGSTGATLPATLSFNVNTGVVSGTAQNVFSTTGYSVRAVGPNGTSLAMPFYLTVKDAIPAFEYGSALNTFVKGQVGTAFGPSTLTGSGAINFYALFNNAEQPAVLPAGLNFNNSTGQVTGTPIVSNHGVPVTYKVKAYGPGGESSEFKTFQLQVDETAPVIAYNTAARVYTVGKLITTFGPTSTQHDINSWSILDNNLPDGLTFDSSTGVIGGIPAATGRTNGSVNVRVRATGDGGNSNEVTIPIEVNFDVPVFAYEAGVKTVMAGEISTFDIQTAPTANQGSGNITYSIAPALTGMSFNSSTGQVIVNTTELGGPVEYTVTAHNGDNSSTAKITLNVDTNVTGATDLTVEIGNADYDAKVRVSTTSNDDIVYIKKVSAGNLVDASLVYEDSSNPASPVLVEIAKQTLISGDFVAFNIDRAIQKPQNQTQKLYVFPAFVAGTSVTGDAVAWIQFEPAQPFAPPEISGLNATYSFVKDTAITSIQLTATGELNANPWSATGLPASLSIDSSTGVISGTPTAVAGNYNVSVSVAGKGGIRSVNTVITITNPPPTVYTDNLPSNAFTITGYDGFTRTLTYVANVNFDLSNAPSSIIGIYRNNTNDIGAIVNTGTEGQVFTKTLNAGTIFNIGDTIVFRIFVNNGGWQAVNVSNIFTNS